MSFSIPDVKTTFDEKFYMTYSRDRPNELIPWIEKHSVPLLTNALHRWSNNTDSFMDMWKYDTDHVIDAGGYNVQSTYADRWGNIKVDEEDVKAELETESPFYPWKVEDYHEWLSQYEDEIEWASVMDYACEDRFDNLWSVQDRVDTTIENTIKHYDLDPDYEVLPVLQGRSVDSYIESYNRLEDAGIKPNVIGLGTICRLSSTEEILEVESKVRDYIDVDFVHGFGVKVDSFSRGATFSSADSAAWVYGASNGRVYTLEQNGDKLRRVEHQEDCSVIRTVESFKTYYAYVTWLKSGKSAVPIEPRLDFREEYENGMDEETFRKRWV
jgi:hypothetical protein